MSAQDGNRPDPAADQESQGESAEQTGYPPKARKYESQVEDKREKPDSGSSTPRTEQHPELAHHMGAQSSASEPSADEESISRITTGSGADNEDNESGELQNSDVSELSLTGGGGDSGTGTSSTSRPKIRRLEELLITPYIHALNLADYLDQSTEDDPDKHPLVTYHLVEKPKGAGRFIDPIAAKLWVPSLHTHTHTHATVRSRASPPPLSPVPYSPQQLQQQASMLRLRGQSPPPILAQQLQSAQSVHAGASQLSVVSMATRTSSPSPPPGRVRGHSRTVSDTARVWGGGQPITRMMPLKGRMFALRNRLSSFGNEGSEKLSGLDASAVYASGGSAVNGSRGASSSSLSRKNSGSTRTINGPMFQQQRGVITKQIPSVNSSAVSLASSNLIEEANPARLIGEHEDTYFFDIAAPPLAFYRHIPKIYGEQPPCLSGHTCTLVGDKIYMYGGRTPSGYNERLYVYNCVTSVLTCPQVSGTLPPPLKDLTATYVPGNHHIYFFGGDDEHRCSRTVHALDVETLTFRRPNVMGRQPEARRGHSSVLREVSRKPSRHRTSANHHSSRSVTDLRSPGSATPEKQSYDYEESDVLRHGTVGDTEEEFRSKVAASRPQVIQRTRSYDPRKRANDYYSPGTEQPGDTGSFEPEEEENPNQTYFPYTIYIFGGLNDSRKALSDIWKLQISTDPYECAFSEVISLDKDTPIWPSARAYHTAHEYKGSMIVCGGTDGMQTVYDKIWTFDFLQEKWTIAVPHSSKPRCMHISAIQSQHLIVIGGHDSEKCVTTVDILNMNNWTWHTRFCNGVQSSGQCYHKGVFADSRFFIIGGLDPFHILAGLRIIEMPNIRL